MNEELWKQYDDLIGHIATTAYIERGESIGGYLAEQDKLAAELRAKLTAPSSLPLGIEQQRTALIQVVSGRAGLMAAAGPKELPQVIDMIDALIAAVRHAPLAPQWQPIETAKKDGRRILTPEGIAHWDVFYKRWSVSGDPDAFTYSAPKYWMPLPLAPQEEGESK